MLSETVLVIAIETRGPTQNASLHHERLDASRLSIEQPSFRELARGSEQKCPAMKDALVPSRSLFRGDGARASIETGTNRCKVDVDGNETYIVLQSRSATKD